MQRPLRIGHRGAAGHAPENTLLSIEKAISFGVDVVEIDVHQSRDGHLIVMHDERVDRTTKGKGFIRDLTLEQLRTLGIPTLADVLDAVRSKAALMIELKVRGVAADAAAIAGSASVYYASFRHSELLQIRDLLPDAKTIALIDAVPVSLTAFATDARATHAGIAIDTLEQDFVSALQHAGIAVFTWTVDEPEDIAYAVSLGVDGLISNYPDRLP
jgi:glycerophosphoryl diester phosphodiesterase